MGSNCCSQVELDKQNLCLTSNASLSLISEISIQKPPISMRIKQIPQFHNTVFCAQLPSIEMKESDPIAINHAPLASNQKQLKTVQNILQIMNGQVDQIINNYKGKNHQKKKYKPKRVKLEDLEKLF